MKKRVLSIVLAMALCLTLLPTAAWAEEPDAEPGGEPGGTEQGVLSEAEPETEVWTVTAFDDLAENVASQTLPQLVEDGEDEGPNLPDTLGATAYQVEDDTQPIIIEVTWEAEPDFDPATPGEYVYTPALPEGYALAEGVELPTITVTVEAVPDPPDEPPQDTQAETPQDTQAETPQDTQAETPTVEDEPVAQDAGDTTADTWADAADTSWYTDHETDSSFTISTAAELAGLASLVNSGTTFSGKTITLNNSIDLNSQSWTPIGTGSNSFQGTFDGSGNTVSHLTVNITSDHAGLFGCVNGGTVKNLNVEGTVTVKGAQPFAGGVVGYTNATVENCSFSGAVTGTASVLLCIGGVVGYAHTNSTVANCYNTGNVSGSDSVGGVVGYAGMPTPLESYNVAVSYCYFLQDENTNQGLSGVGGSNVTLVSGKAEDKTADEFASGEVAYLLNGGDTQDETSPWRQNLGGADADGSPVLDSTHAQVVKLGNGSYANAPKTDETGVYLIYTADDLVAFAALVNSSSSSVDAKLMKDIDLSSVCGESVGEGGGAVSWTPIGNTSSSNPNAYFQGIFDGQGHTVSGLYMNITRTDNDDTYGGLFGDMRGTVKNLNVSGTVTATNEKSIYVYVGGVVGEADKAIVENCSFAGKVTGTGTSIYVGGVVGKSSGTVSNCYFLQDTGTNTGLHGIGNNTTSTGAEPKTAAAFASGEVAYLLSGGDTQDPDSPWRQNLGDEDADGSPVLDSTHARVVQVGGAYLNLPEPDTDGVYEISTAAELVWFANEVNSGNKTISGRLIDNIDLSTVCGATIGEGGAAVSWTPIGNSSFKGTFDGQGHTVSGLYVNTTSGRYVGLFGCVYGGTVENLMVNGTVTGAYSSSYIYVGGMVGSIEKGGTVTNCSFSGSVTGSGPYAYVGGVVGNASGSSAVKNCYHTGSVTASGTTASYSGGVAGAVQDKSTMENCYFLQTDENSSLSGIGKINNGSSTKVEGKDSAAFASGEVAHLLQAGQETQYWGQTLGTDEVTYPVLTSDAAKAVAAVTFMTKDETGDDYTKYAEKYTNAGGTVTLPDTPTSSAYVFCAGRSRRMQTARRLTRKRQLRKASPFTPWASCSTARRRTARP